MTKYLNNGMYAMGEMLSDRYARVIAYLTHMMLAAIWFGISTYGALTGDATLAAGMASVGVVNLALAGYWWKGI